jgi:hypothetical protein
VYGSGPGAVHLKPAPPIAKVPAAQRLLGSSASALEIAKVPAAAHQLACARDAVTCGVTEFCRQIIYFGANSDARSMASRSDIEKRCAFHFRADVNYALSKTEAMRCDANLRIEKLFSARIAARDQWLGISKLQLAAPFIVHLCKDVRTQRRRR